MTEPGEHCQAGQVVVQVTAMPWSTTMRWKAEKSVDELQRMLDDAKLHES